MNKLFSVAIDGPSGAGKSTVARAVAEKTGALYLDTGAMYRAAALGMRRSGVDLDDARAVARAVEKIELGVRHQDGAQRVYLDGEDVSDAIRASEISMAASRVSAVPEVRERMVAMQRAIARGLSVVMDGRDIGTKVLPEATLKIYLVADPAERARRRTLDLRAKGLDEPYGQVYEAMLRRDRDDENRAASPLTRAPDAVELDSTHWTSDETAERVLSLLRGRLEGKT